MLKEIITNIINRALGKYVENFDSSQFTLGLGDIVFNNLELKSNCFDDLNIPVRLIYGKIGKFSLKLSYLKFFSSPSIVEIDELFLLIVPNQHATYDEETEKRQAQEAKEAELRKVEEAKKKALEKAQGVEKPQVDKTFVEKIASTFIKNIEVKIKNIHLRFEDRISHAGQNFSFGITLSSLEVKTVPPWGETVRDPLNLVFKELTISWLCFYWNSKDKLFQLTCLNKKKELEKHFRDGVGSQANVPPSYHYLLGPINAKSNLRINMHPESDGTNFAIPKFSLSFDLEGLLICMTKEQYEDLILFLETLSFMKTASLYRKFRPNVMTYHGHEKEWWHFAYKCVVDDIRRKKKDWDWNHIKMHRHKFREYVKAYANKLKNQSKAAEALCKQYESELNVLNIVLARQKSEREVALQNVTSIAEAKKAGGFFSRFFFGGNGGEKSPETESGDSLTVSITKMQEVLSQEERDDMYKAIGYTEGETPTDYPEVFVEFDLSAIIHKIEIKLIDENKINTMTVSLKEGVTSVQQRPASKSLTVLVSIEQFHIEGLDQNGTIPVLLSTKTIVSKEKPLVKVIFETNPLDNKSIDQKIHVFAEPLLVVYDALTINNLIKLFTVQENTVTSKIQAAAQAKLQEFKEVSALGLQNMLEHHIAMEVRIIIQASSVLLPQNGFYVEGCPMLTVTLGNIKILTLPRKEFIAKDAVKEMDTQSVEYLMEYSYDNFVLELSDLQVVLAMPEEKWNAPTRDMYFLKPTSLTINLGKCVITDDARLPKLKFSGQLSTVHFSIAEQRLKDCLSLLMSVPVPESSTPTTGSEQKYEENLFRQSNLSLTGFSYERHSALLELDVEERKSEPIKQAFEIDAKFELKELLIDIMVINNGRAEELLKFRLSDLEAVFTQYTFVMAVQLKLGSVNMRHNFENDWLNVISNSPIPDGDDNYLFSVKYYNVNKNIPEFHTKYKSTIQMIEVDFTKLELMLHCEALCSLMVWADDFSKCLAPPEEPKFKKSGDFKSSSIYLATTKFGSKLDIRGSTGMLSGKFRKTQASKLYKVDEIKIKIKARLGEIAILLWKNKRQLSSLGVTGGECVLGVKATYTQIDLKLRGVYLYNHDPTTLYRKILTSKEEADVLSLRFVNFENVGKRNDAVDMSVNLSFAAVRFVFVNRFIMSLLSFLDHFSAARKKIIDASTAAAEAAKQNVQDVFEKATRVSLSIDLEAPKIVIPVSDKYLIAFILDLGLLTANNSFLDVKVPSSEESAVLDRLNVDLRNLQLTQVLFDEDVTKELSSHAIIEPISFVLTLQRNLSSGWFLDVPDIEIGGKLQAIKIKFNKLDYKQIMQMLEENIGDSGPPDENPPPKAAPPAPKRITLSQIEEETIKAPISGKHGLVRSTLKFTMALESLVLELEDNNANDPDVKEGLARLTLELVSLKGSMMSDDSLHFALILLDFIMDDLRPSKVGKITRYMERKKGPNEDNDSFGKSMIDVTYQQTSEAKFADVRISSIDLILNLEHLTKVGEFFSKLSDAPPVTVEDIKAPTKLEPPKKRETVLVTEEKVDVGRVSVNFKVEHPDIILIENIDDIDTNALVLDFELTITANMGNDKSLISGSLTDLQLFTCCYNPSKRKATKSPVLNPVSFLVSGCGEDGNTRIEIDSTRIKVSVTPGVVMLLSKVVSTLTSSSSAVAEDSITQAIDRTTMWDITDFHDSDFSFLKTEIAEDALAEVENSARNISRGTILPKQNKMESISFKIMQITVTLEAGFGRTTMPLLFADASLDVSAFNWSSKMHVDAKLFLEVSYYNSQHAMWEPLLEPVPVRQNPDTYKTEHSPWKIRVLVDTLTEDDIAESISKPGTTPDTDSELAKHQALTLLSVRSEDILNITVSKKSLEVLTGLSATLSAAIFQPEEYEGDKSPYVVKNECGLTVKILLDDEFVVYSYAEEENVDVKFVVLDHDSYVGLKSSSEIEYLGLSEETKEKFIHVRVVDYNCDVLIPVLKSAKRFFPIGHRGPGNDQWGIVTDVMITNGQTMVTLRGVIQVENDHNMPINVYSMTDKENELHLIGTVKPKDLLNLPLDSIYTQTTELFFSADGYTVSIVPYVWKDLQNCVQKSKILRCNPKSRSNTQPLFLRVDGELEQIFFENSARHTMLSTCFKLSIRPTVTFKNILPIKVHVLIQGIPGEHPVLPAMTIQIPTAEPGNSSLVIRIPDYLDREWSCKYELLEDPPELSVWSFDSYESDRHITIDLGIHMELSHGTHMYTLYCPFWMINKTGLQLAYKHPDEANTLFHPDNYTGVIMFSFRAKSFFAKKKSSIRVFDGPWSDKFSLDAVGSSGVVICRHEDQVYHIGVKIQLSNNPLTKEVVFTPFYVFLNNFKKQSLEVREVTDVMEYKWQTVPPEDCIPFWPYGKPDTSRLQVRIQDTEETTINFPFNKSHNSVLKVANKYGAIDVDVQLSDGGAYISFYPYEVGMAPVLIMNQTNHTVDLRDMSVKDICYYLKPRQKMLFTWEKIDDNHQISFCKGEFTSNLKDDSMGPFITRNNEQLFWSTFLYGPQRVFLITDSQIIAAESINLSDYEIISNSIEVRLQGIGISLVDNNRKRELLYISLSSSDVMWEARKPDKKLFKKLSANDSNAIERCYKDYADSCSYGFDTNPVVKVNNRITVNFQTMKMTLPTEKDLHRCYVDGVWINLKTSLYLTRFHMKINSIQIDQQVYDCLFPVIFAPVPPPKSVMNQLTPKPFLELSVVKLSNQFSYLQQYKYFGVLIQEFHFRADSGILSSLMNFFEPVEVSEETQIALMDADVKRAQEPLCFFVRQTSKQELKNYYSKLHLSPLKMHMSFSLSSVDNNMGEDSLLPPIVSVFMQSFGVTLTDVDDVIFRISCFERQSIFVTQSQLLREVQSHYVSQILQQIYVVILGLDVIGNPFGLISGLKTGATDFFYEPIQGAIRGPGEFAEGLVLGVRSLFGHTVGGAAGAVSKMTGALGKGLAALTFDDDYQRQRREMQRSKPATMQEGFARSGKGLVMGVIEGVGGVVTKPISGAKQEGVSGFFKGVGKGMVGLITRPTAGIVDFASGSLGAVRRATEVSSELPRKRIPRYIRPDGLIKPYCEQEAEGNRYLQELDKGKYAKTDEYVFHMPIGYATKYKDVLLFTDRRMVYLAYNEIFGGYQLEWGHTWLEITKEPESVNDGIKFWVDKKSSFKNFFTSPDSGKILFIENNNLKSHVVRLMNQLILKNVASLNRRGTSSMSLSSGEVCKQFKN